MNTEKKGPGRPATPEELKPTQKSVYLWPETRAVLLDYWGDLSNQTVNLAILQGAKRAQEERDEQGLKKNA